ncbi:hypothetical protein Pmani_026665 [Petrolisthes manimaculis]|uniref:FAS1 domain-containing protein n=1 Tax=Petrolisthes manimaculis TaxID=1843537 RepID=A0AAE1TXL8_9EUCA|nr:hypothetical protein Pmani_026665 [Petrolisthes manimaculis]
MHIVPNRLTTDEIVAHTVTQEDTLSPRRNLYFAVNNPNEPVPIVSLEGGGVNATITTPNIAAKNGVIHIIDRILGIPSQTVYEKLATDPMLSDTFALSEQNNWNERLKDRGSQRFTLFVPSNAAWEYIHRNIPSGYKKLFMGGYAYQGKAILERHMIVGNDWSIDELNSLTTNTTKPGLFQVPLNVTRGKIYFQARVREAFGEYTLEWNGISARVIRPDVECVNGVVHVIDKVLMARRDVTVISGSAASTATALATLAATFVAFAVARTLSR